MKQQKNSLTPLKTIFAVLAIALIAASCVSNKSTSKKATGDGFSINKIDDGLKQRMIKGKSYPEEGALISLDELRYLKMLYKTKDGETKQGEMIVNKAIAKDVLEIFKELYKNNYPIERMELIDNYNAVDEDSMTANNSSSFCYRAVSGTTNLSLHARGLAVDINPLYNPYVVDPIKGRFPDWHIEPAAGKPYIDRTKDFPYKIDHDDLAYKLFTEHGFEWGGDWMKDYLVADYQHFEKEM